MFTSCWRWVSRFVGHAASLGGFHDASPAVTFEGVLGRTYDSQVCSVARCLEAVGERWSLLIVRDALFAGSTRYSHFQRSLGIATNVLQARLDGFVDAGIMRRRRYSEQPELYEYLLTEKGRDLAPALVALTEWGDRWAAPDGPPVLYTHTVCGSGVSQAVVCQTCGPLDDPAGVAARPGPGMPAERISFMDKVMAGRSPGSRAEP
jgi:DNA-binding HxlR family transcriptional regulator